MNPRNRPLKVRPYLALSLLALLGCGGGGGGGGDGPAPTPATWLVMVYVAADNNLDDSVPFDLNLMELAPASSRVKVVVQVDTHDLAVNGSTAAQRILIQHDADINTVTSPTIQNLGEINSVDPLAVQDFVVWAKTTYPSNRHVLILWDHGGQWGGWGEDETSGAGALTYQEIQAMFVGIQTAAALPKFDVIGFDACLMAGVELDQLLAPFATYRVASCELEMGGWNYADGLAALTANPSMSPAAFGKAICDSFIGLKNLLGATNQTQSVVSLAKVAPLTLAIDAFAASLRVNLAAELVDCIAPSRRLAAEYGKLQQDQPSFFIDLRDFAARVEGLTIVPALATAAGNVLAAIDAAVTHRAQGPDASSHRGVSIYFPNCSCDPNQLDYPNVDLTTSTQWDEFIEEYQALMFSDVTAPGVLINGVSSFNVSTAAPVTVNFTVTGNDIVDVSAMISYQLSPTVWVILGEMDFGTIPEGTYDTEWDGAVFAIEDGVSASYLPAWSIQANSTLYLAIMRHEPVVGAVQNLLVILNLDWVAETGSILGFFEVTASGTLGSRQVVEDDLLVMQLPVWDINTGTLTYQDGVALQVPVGGTSAMTIFQAEVPDGSIDFDIFAEDYAENIGLDTVQLTVP